MRKNGREITHYPLFGWKDTEEQKEMWEAMNSMGPTNFFFPPNL